MLRFLFTLAIGAAFYVLVDREQRERFLERVKQASDRLVSGFLLLTSQFGSELTTDGWDEQRMWRERRLRDLAIPRWRDSEPAQGEART